MLEQASIFVEENSMCKSPAPESMQGLEAGAQNILVEMFGAGASIQLCGGKSHVQMPAPNSMQGLEAGAQNILVGMFGGGASIHLCKLE